MPYAMKIYLCPECARLVRVLPLKVMARLVSCCAGCGAELLDDEEDCL